MAELTHSSADRLAGEPHLCRSWTGGDRAKSCRLMVLAGIGCAAHVPCYAVPGRWSGGAWLAWICPAFPSETLQPAAFEFDPGGLVDHLALAVILVRWFASWPVGHGLLLAAGCCPAGGSVHGSIQPDRRQPAYRHLAARLHQSITHIPAGIISRQRAVAAADFGDRTLDVARSTDFYTSAGR